MPALVSTPARSSVNIRPDLAYVIVFKEAKFSEAIARFRVGAVANAMLQALLELDPQGEYAVMQSNQKQFDYCLLDLRMQPNMVVAELIGRTEAAILYRKLVRIDPLNQTRYAIARAHTLEIQGAASWRR
jgi:hypothetical protein